MKKSLFLLIISSFFLFFTNKNEKKIEVKQSIIIEQNDTIISKKHKVNKITCDLDGDGKNEIVEIVKNTKNKKSGLKITYGNKQKIDYLGMGSKVLGQNFDDFDWVDIFEKAPKNKIYGKTNVDKNGNILPLRTEDKIKLKNDGIFMHVDEACGGGIIYLKNGKYEWIQQE